MDKNQHFPAGRRNISKGQYIVLTQLANLKHLDYPVRSQAHTLNLFSLLLAVINSLSCLHWLRSITHLCAFVGLKVGHYTLIGNTYRYYVFNALCTGLQDSYHDTTADSSMGTPRSADCNMGTPSTQGHPLQSARAAAGIAGGRSVSSASS